MSSIQTASSSPEAMSSSEIAALTGKNKSHIHRDIKEQLLIGLYEINDPNLDHFEIKGVSIIKNDKGNWAEVYLDREHTLTLITGYDVKARHAINKRWLELETQKPQPPSVDMVRVSKVSKALIALARAYGLKGNQALLSADTATKNLEGVSPLALLGISLVSDVKRKLMTPSEIGLQVGGLSAQKVNKLLAGLGFQVKIDEQWEPTVKGQMLGEMLDTNKKHSDGTPVKQWKWYSTIIDEIATTEAA